MFLTKFDKQQLLSKHAKLFAAGKHTTEDVFQGIRHSGNGTVYVSDIHILLRMKDASPFSEPVTLHALTGAEIEGTYPSNHALENLLTWEPENQIVLTPEQIEVATHYAKIAQMIEKELKAAVKTTHIQLNGGVANLETYNEAYAFTARIGRLAKEQNEEFIFNADYIYNALNLFKSAKTDCLTIKLRHKNDSILLSDGESGIDVLILPIRSA